MPQVQRFRMDPATGLLVQHDYTAEVFGNWAKAANVVLVHGEYPAQQALAERLKEEFGWEAKIPDLGDSITL